MAEFREWMITEEGCDGYMFADLMLGICHLHEAKKAKKKDWQRTLWNLSPELKSLPPPDERKVNGTIEVPKFDPEAAKHMAPFDDDDEDLDDEEFDEFDDDDDDLDDEFDDEEFDDDDDLDDDFDEDDDIEDDDEDD